MRRREFISIARRRGGCLAGSPRAPSRASRRGASLCSRAAPRPDDRDAQANDRGVPGKCCSNWAGPTERDVRIEYALGPRAMPPTFARMRGRIGRSRSGRHPEPLAPRAMAPLLHATRTAPIVFVNVPDPVGAGLVDSLARPGGNATGFIRVRIQHLSGKWLELLKQTRAGRDPRGGPSRPRNNLRHRPIRRDPVRGAVGREWRCAR